jgi:glucose-6-phosphate 1-dehydrogenase
MVVRVIPVDPFDLVIFGGTGDLARRKILPGLYRRHLAGQMPVQSRIIGAARSDMTDLSYRSYVREAIEEFVPADRRRDADVSGFLERISYITLDAKGTGGWLALKAAMQPDVVRAFYFSVAPTLFGDIAQRLHEHGIADAQSRIVVEKPFGRDLATAKALNAVLAQHFSEAQIYRIDHYLCKYPVRATVEGRIYRPCADYRGRNRWGRGAGRLLRYLGRDA